MEEEEEIPRLSQENFADFFTSSLQSDTDPIDRDLLTNNIDLPTLHVSSLDLELDLPQQPPLEYIPGTDAFAELLSTIEIPSELIIENMTIPGYPPVATNFSGFYNFDVSFETPEKRSSWVYSAERDKLYVTKDMAVPINILANTFCPSGAKIRAMAVFEQPQFANTVVTRCQHHAAEDRAKGVFAADCLIRCESRKAQYEIINNMYTVAVPYESPQRGQQYSTYIYKFTCFSSCPGTLERKPVKIIFVLEHNHTIYGHRAINIKICACPARDHKNDDNQQAASSSKAKTTKRKMDQVQTKSEPVDSFSLVAMPAVDAVSNSSCPLASNNWPGDYDFDFRFNTEDCKNYKYSASRDKLYIVKDAQCSLMFSTKSTAPPGLTVRVTAMFLLPQYAHENVQRCAHHVQLDTAAGQQNSDHLIRCDHNSAIYCMDLETQRLSVCIPFFTASGFHYPSYNFKFCCFGSCPGGLNRRRIKVIFTLEIGNEVIGRRSLEVKICASPHRDCKNDDVSSTNTTSSTTTTPKNLPKKMKKSLETKVDIDDPPSSKEQKKKKGIYSLIADTIEEYKFLKEVQIAYRQSTESSDASVKEETSTDESE